MHGIPSAQYLRRIMLSQQAGDAASHYKQNRPREKKKNQSQFSEFIKDTFLFFYFPREKLLEFLKENRKQFAQNFEITTFFADRKGYFKKLTWIGEPLDTKIYFDAPYNFILWYKGEPLAVLGFKPVDSAAILVIQIQAVKHNYGYLKDFRWEKFMLGLAMDWAFKNGFDEVRVQSAQENRWFKNRKDDIKDTFKMRYDVTPKRMGFKLHESKMF